MRHREGCRCARADYDSQCNPLVALALFQFGGKRAVGRNLHSDLSVSVFRLNPGNDLSLRVGSNVRDLVRKVHVPVNAAHGKMAFSSAKLQSAAVL